MDVRRQIPSIDRLLALPAMHDLIRLYGRELVRVQVRREVDRLRSALDGAKLGPEALELEVARLPERVEASLGDDPGPPLARVLNATGVFLHTNLGRAPLDQEVAATLPSYLDAYCDLEIDLESGRRSDRNRRVAGLLKTLTGAEAALVVNNNAAALLLALAGLARGRQVIVSRGELVEIGGSFRIPEILEAAGAELVEVGTTNRTRLSDYERRIGERTALLLKVFPSNYRISGFVQSVAPAELVALGRERSIPVMVDEGSGLLRPHRAPQLAGHPSLQELMAAGCDLACGSGDKLVGGPQAGLMVGRRRWVDACLRHPLYRALRPDRTACVGLEQVLRRHLADRPLPLDGLWPEPEVHRRRLLAIAGELGAEIVPAEAYVGGGSAPESPVPGEALALPGGESLLRRLRRGRPPVVGYVRRERLLLDLRTVAERDDETLVAAVRRALEPAAP